MLCSPLSPPFPRFALSQALRFESFDRIKEGLHLQLVEFYEQGVEATEEMRLKDDGQERHSDTFSLVILS